MIPASRDCPACAATAERLDRLEAGLVAIARAVVALADPAHPDFAHIGAAMSAATRALKARLDALEAEVERIHDGAHGKIADARNADAAELAAMHVQLDRLSDKLRAFGESVAEIHKPHSDEFDPYRIAPVPRADGYVGSELDPADQA